MCHQLCKSGATSYTLLTDHVKSLTQPELMNLSWQVADKLFFDGQLEAPAVLLFEADCQDVTAITSRTMTPEAFRSTVMEAASEVPMVAAVYVCQANFAFGTLPDGSKPLNDFNAGIEVVTASSSGERLAESRRIIPNHGLVRPAQSTRTPMPAALLVDEIVAMGATIH